MSKWDWDNLYGEKLNYRTIERMLFDWAKNNPWSIQQVWLTNTHTSSEDIFYVDSDTEGRLTPFSITSLREARRNVDWVSNYREADFSNYKVYSVEPKKPQGVKR